ncbi:hypothetical protein, partial [Burkholderia multivorans]
MIALTGPDRPTSDPTPDEGSDRETAATPEPTPFPKRRDLRGTDTVFTQETAAVEVEVETAPA